MVEMRNAYKIVVWKPEGTGPLKKTDEGVWTELYYIYIYIYIKYIKIENK